MTRIPPFRAVIFDMDGVLVDSEPLHLEATNRVLARYGRFLDPETAERFMGLPEETFWAALKAHFDLPASIRELREARYVALMEVLLTRPFSPSPGLQNLINLLRRRGIRLGLASSSPPLHIGIVLVKTGLAGVFDAALSGEEVERGKPEPDIFLKTAELLGVPPQACLAIEDSRNGILAARRAGMFVVAYRPRSNARGLAPIEVQSFQELVEKLG